MSSKALLLVCISALLTAVGNLSLRGGVIAGGGLSLDPATFFRQLAALCKEPLFLMGGFLYGCAAIIWFAALSLDDISSIYPILVGLTFILIVLGASGIYGESISLQKLAGMTAILIGVALVART